MDMHTPKFGINNFELDLTLDQFDTMIIMFAIWNLPDDFEGLKKRYAEYFKQEGFDASEKETEELIDRSSHIVMGMIPALKTKLHKAMFEDILENGLPKGLRNMIEKAFDSIEGVEGIETEIIEPHSVKEFMQHLGLKPEDIEEEYDEIDEP